MRITTRKILKELKNLSREKESQAQVALRMRKAATTRADYEHWRQAAIMYHEFSEQLDAFIEIYKVF